MCSWSFFKNVCSHFLSLNVNFPSHCRHFSSVLCLCVFFLFLLSSFLSLLSICNNSFCLLGVAVSVWGNFRHFVNLFWYVFDNSLSLCSLFPSLNGFFVPLISFYVTLWTLSVPQWVFSVSVSVIFVSLLSFSHFIVVICLVLYCLVDFSIRNVNRLSTQEPVQDCIHDNNNQTVTTPASLLVLNMNIGNVHTLTWQYPHEVFCYCCRSQVFYAEPGHIFLWISS